MAKHIVLQDYSDQEYRFAEGDVIDDDLYPLATLQTRFVPLVVWTPAHQPKLESFLFQRSRNPLGTVHLKTILEAYP